MSGYLRKCLAINGFGDMLLNVLDYQQFSSFKLAECKQTKRFDMRSYARNIIHIIGSEFDIDCIINEYLKTCQCRELWIT